MKNRAARENELLNSSMTYVFNPLCPLSQISTSAIKKSEEQGIGKEQVRG